MKACRLLILALGLGLLMSSPVLANSDIAMHLKAAQDYMETEQWDYANYEWRNVLSKDPGNSKAIAGLGRSLINAGMAQEAVRHLEEARRKYKKHVSIDMALADAYAASGNYISGQRGYEFILSHDDMNVEAFRKLNAIKHKLPPQRRQAVEQYLLKRNRQALLKAEKALEDIDYRTAAEHLALAAVYNADERIMNNFGLTLLLTGKSQQAAQTFYNLSRKNPEEWRFHANMAMSYLGVGKNYQARQELERAIGLCDDDMHRARLYNNLGYAYEAASKPTYARFAYERAIKTNPGLVKARMNLAYIFQRLMEYDNAVKTYKELLAKWPDRADAWNQLGFTYELMHEPKKAVSAYRKAISLDPELEEAYFNLGTLYKKMDKIDKASEVYRKMVELEFYAIEQADGSEKPAPKQPKQTRLIDYVYLYFDDLST